MVQNPPLPLLLPLLDNLGGDESSDDEEVKSDGEGGSRGRMYRDISSNFS